MPVASARQIVFDLLCRVHQGQRTLDHWLEGAEPQIGKLNKADRSLVHAMVYGTLRWQEYLDYIVDHLAKAPGKIDAQTRIILRLALFQILKMDRVPASAAVNTAVELAKQNKRSGTAGFINALLRKACASADKIPWPDDRKDQASALAVRQSLPLWLAKRWIDRWGYEDALRLCRAINAIPSVPLRVNTLKMDRPTLMAAIRDEASAIHETQFSPDGVVLTSLSRPMTEWDGFREGWFQVQDEAAQLVAHCLAPEPGALVWDACAGLGTKTAHLSQLMENKGRIIATDANPAKLARLEDEMRRLGISIVSTRPLDLAGSTDLEFPRFDHILVDAPCSGLGVLQKNPDGKWQTGPDAPDRCRMRQIGFLERAAPFLRTGGTMVYAVCSFEPEENAEVVKAFLQKHPDFAIDPLRLTAVSQPDALVTPQGWLNTFPHQHGMDGFFAAVFRRL